MMKFGLTPKQYEMISEVIVTPLKQVGAKVYVFGSRARGRQHPFSDIDILLEFPTKDIPHALISKCRERIEESNLPIKVDLVVSSDLAKSYQDGVNQDKIEF